MIARHFNASSPAVLSCLLRTYNSSSLAHPVSYAIADALSSTTRAYRPHYRFPLATHGSLYKRTDDYRLHENSFAVSFIRLTSPCQEQESSSSSSSPPPPLSSSSTSSRLKCPSMVSSPPKSNSMPFPHKTRTAQADPSRFFQHPLKIL
jgi:hypothetical protein